jgi:hypothetical protein
MRNLFAMFLTIALVSIGVISAAEVHLKAEQRKNVAMQVQAAYPIVVTSKLGRVPRLLCPPVRLPGDFEASWFVYMTSDGDHP